MRGRLTQTAEKCSAKVIRPYTPNIFKGKVFCGVCGEPLHRQRCARKKTDDVYLFHCLSNSRKARGSCVPYSMPEHDLSALLMDTIGVHAGVLMGKEIRLRGEANPVESEKAKAVAELATVRKELDRDGRMLKSLFENLATGAITAEEYREMRSVYEERDRWCAGRAAELEQRLEELGKQAEEFATLSRVAAGANAAGVSAELLECLVDRIRIFPDRHIDVDLRFSTGFGLLREVLGNG